MKSIFKTHIILICLSAVFSPAVFAQESSETGTRNAQLAALEKVREQMTQVQAQFQQAETSVAQQQIQRDIIKQLESLLQQQGKSQEQSAQSQEQKEQSNNPKEQESAGNESKSENEATLGQARPFEKQKLLRKELQDKIWGHLPDRLRNQMQNIDTDKFLPKYRHLIEAYYRRLSTEFAD